MSWFWMLCSAVCILGDVQSKLVVVREYRRDSTLLKNGDRLRKQCQLQALLLLAEVKVTS